MISSYIEILDIESGAREIFWRDSQIVEAPNWSKDGYLLVNSEGLLFKIYFENTRKELVDTGFAKNCNNDHGISFDGSQIVISSHDPDDSNPLAWQTSKIYTLPINGGKPTLITPNNSCFWHGWSPDGNVLIYTALRNNQWDIYGINIHGGNEFQLTNSKYQHDGSEYSPCGKYIYYNSYDSGYMEIWRMNADGSNQIQLTNDCHSNWFPHISPDNSKMIYICYIEDQKEAHPFGKNVKLRMMDLKTQKNIDITDEFYGGQGTLNVNSWSPDRKKIAFVRYENLKKL